MTGEDMLIQGYENRGARQTLQKCHMGRPECHRIRCRHPAVPVILIFGKRAQEEHSVTNQKEVMEMTVLEVRNLKKIYRPRFGGNQVQALSRVTFSVEEGEYVAIMGGERLGENHAPQYHGGAGQTYGRRGVSDGKPLSSVKDKDISEFRRDNLGFVFQEFNLLDTFNIRDNILLPLVLKGLSYKAMPQKLLPIARELGIESLLDKYPYEVSGGQKQRAAAARALITDPRILLADEPTGALDSRSTDELLALFAKINSRGQTILMVTHSVKAGRSRAGRVLFIKDGEVFHQLYRGDMTDEQFYQRISDTLTMLATGGERR